MNRLFQFVEQRRLRPNQNVFALYHMSDKIKHHLSNHIHILHKTSLTPFFRALALSYVQRSGPILFPFALVWFAERIKGTFPSAVARGPEKALARLARRNAPLWARCSILGSCKRNFSGFGRAYNVTTLKSLDCLRQILAKPRRFRNSPPRQFRERRVPSARSARSLPCL